MTEPKDIVRKLTHPKHGNMTEMEIVDALKNLGVKVTQPTINRIKKGQKRTSYDIGRALQQLCEQRLSA